MRGYEDSDCSTPSPVWKEDSDQPELFVPRPWECPVHFRLDHSALVVWACQRLYNRAANHNDLVTWACRRFYQRAEFMLHLHAQLLELERMF